jgi:hypothetical protein
LVKFFKKFEYLLVRPSLEQKLEIQMRTIKMAIQRDFFTDGKVVENKAEAKIEKFEKMKYSENVIYYA